MPDNNESATISVEECAKSCGIGRSLAYDLARRGELPGVLRLGQKRLRVSRAALERYLAEGSVGHDKLMA